MIKAFGKFKGGNLGYWPEDDKSQPLEKLRAEDRVTFDLSQNLVLFDGNRAHEVDEFQGERASVVWFTTGRWWKAREDERRHLLDCGFVIPEGRDPGPIMTLMPKPRGYQNCKSLGSFFGQDMETAKVFQWPDVVAPEEEREAQRLLRDLERPDRRA